MILIRKFVNSLFTFGKPVNRKKIVRRDSLTGVMEHLIDVGCNIRTIIDVGVAEGTYPLYEAYPDAKIFLVEPVVEYLPYLENIVEKFEDSEIILSAAYHSSTQLIINIHPDLVGSSLYKEEEDSDVNGFERLVPTVTLDNLCSKRRAIGPFLIKIDTQGAELDALRGAEKILSQTEILIIEVSFFEFFKGGPQINDCIKFLKDRGFVPYDIFDLNYRPLDGAMSQVDIAFVPEKSFLRRYHYYANREHREKQNKVFLKNRK